MNSKLHALNIILKILCGEISGGWRDLSRASIYNNKIHDIIDCINWLYGDEKFFTEKCVAAEYYFIGTEFDGVKLDIKPIILVTVDSGDAESIKKSINVNDKYIIVIMDINLLNPKFDSLSNLVDVLMDLFDSDPYTGYINLRYNLAKLKLAFIYINKILKFNAKDYDIKDFIKLCIKDSDYEDINKVAEILSLNISDECEITRCLNMDLLIDVLEMKKIV